MKSGRLGQPLDVGDSQTDQQVHQDDRDENGEEEKKELGRAREQLRLHVCIWEMYSVYENY